ncbi:MAG: M28 family peptidase [Gemmatimonadota bacterium]|nr:M28 family peptidase [Gemmatimonadota bacterium]
MHLKRTLFGPLAGLVLPLAIFAVSACQTSGVRERVAYLAEPIGDGQVAAVVDSARIRQTITDLVSFGSRVAGYPGATEAAHYLAGRMREMGLEDVELEEFVASVPHDEGGELTVLDDAALESRTIPIHAVWPNLVRTSTTPPGGITGKLYYVGNGEWEDFNGIDPTGAVFLMDFNSGVNWQRAAQLGAGAVIFVEPANTTRVDGEEKYLQVPVDFPRFWMAKEQARPLVAYLEENGPLTVRAKGRMTWKRLPAYNVLGKITGTHPMLKDEVIVLESYYDSMSPVPAVSPGANQASGAAALLEIARYFAAHPPVRTVYFLATSGHFLSLSGVDDFTNRHTRKTAYFAEKLDEPIDMKLFAGIDLSSARDQIGVAYAGILFAGNSFEKQRFFTPFGRTFMGYADEVIRRGFFPNDALMNVITPSQGILSTEFFPAGNIALDAELVFWTGFPALTFATVFDVREYVDTPLDEIDRVNIRNVYTQTLLLSELFGRAVNDAMLFPDFKMQLEDRFVRGRIRVVEFDPREDYIPSKPKPGAVVRFRRYNKTISGVKNEIFVVADSAGVAESTALEAGRTYPTEGFVMDPETGEIIYAPDRGPYGEGAYPLEITMDWVDKEKPTVVFRSDATNLYDLVDPRFLTRLNEAVVLDESGNPPLEWGITFQEAGWTTGFSYEEDTAVVFTPPDSRFKVTMSTGLFGRRLILTNADEANPEGVGFDSGVGAIPLTSYQVARDMWHLDEARIGALRSVGVNNTRLDDFHRESGRLLDLAEAARQALQWDRFIKYARAAWGYESRAYPDATGTANDVVEGVLFYMVLVIPFAYALERLLFGFANIYKRIGATAGIFLAAYGVLRFTHPAFQITTAPDIVLLAFMTFVLAAVVIWLISQRFSQTMREVRQHAHSVQTTDVRRSSALGTAFALGIGNMRKRKARTLLTCATLVLLVFTVLSFTSVQTFLRIQKVSTDTEAAYTGFLVRNPNWAPLQKQTHQYVRSEFGSTEAEDRGITIVPRSWYAGTAPGVKTYIKAEHTVADGAIHSTYASGILGVMPDERIVSGLDRALVSGRWFESDERDVCIIPTEMARLLGMPEGAGGPVIAEGAGGPVMADGVDGPREIRIFGKPFTVIGIFDSAVMDRITDLDGEPLTPVDYTATGRDLLTEIALMDYEEEPVEMVRFEHLPAANLILAPQAYVNDLGGSLRSVAVRFPADDAAGARLDRFMQRLGIPVVASVDGEVAVHSAMSLSSLSGLGNLFIPMVVAALIILNTMMNAVYERFSEIGVYSAVGLAPAHIGALFMAEAAMYAVIGGMSGYLIGQTVALGITEYQLLAGLTLNYSSLSAVASTAMVMAVVMLSTIYPARQASQMAVPDVNRQWSFPEPEGDDWRFEFPFTISRKETLGLCAYLKRFFESYGESTLGSFMTDEVALTGTNGSVSDASTYEISMKTWLAPYDTGVSQRVSLHASPAQEEHDLYAVWVHIYRLSGDVDSWQRLNRRFLNVLRKQFLVWRTVDQEVKTVYADEGREMIAAETGEKTV